MTLSADLQIYDQGTNTIDLIPLKVFAAFKEAEAAVIQKPTDRSSKKAKLQSYKLSKEAKLQAYINLLTDHLKKQSC